MNFTAHGENPFNGLLILAWVVQSGERGDRASLGDWGSAISQGLRYWLVGAGGWGRSRLGEFNFPLKKGKWRQLSIFFAKLVKSWLNKLTRS